MVNLKKNRAGCFAGILGLVLLTGPVFGDSVFGDQFPAVVEAEQRAVLSAEREGVLSELSVDTGRRVQKNERVAEVYHRDLILQKELREATREYLQIQVDNLTRLNSKGMVTDEEVARARMELEVNRKEINLVENQIERSRLHAPFAGIVMTRHIQPYEWVRPGQPVVELYHPLQLRIVSDIPSDLAVGLKKGQEHKFFFSDLQREVIGRLEVFSPQVDVRSNTIKILWSVKQGAEEPELLPGMKGVLKLGTE
ncbi:MAG: efflux RND transporter periplasmic adaptor subunit [Desulfococcaceae bacterium]